MDQLVFGVIHYALIKCPAFFYVPISFRMWAIIALHNFLYFAAIRNICFFTVHPIPCFAIHLYKLRLLVVFKPPSCLHYILSH